VAEQLYLTDRTTKDIYQYDGQSWAFIGQP
jgi:hypothetical protein